GRIVLAIGVMPASQGAAHPGAAEAAAVSVADESVVERAVGTLAQDDRAVEQADAVDRGGKITAEAATMAVPGGHHVGDQAAVALVGCPRLRHVGRQRNYILRAVAEAHQLVQPAAG